LLSCHAPPTGAFNKYGELKPGHHSRQRAVSLRRRSGGHTLYYKYNAVATLLLIGRTEGPEYQNLNASTKALLHLTEL
jgi:hypothetical protein